MVTPDSKLYEFEDCDYHYLVALKDRDVIHKLLITDKELSKIYLENMIDTFKKPDKVIDSNDTYSQPRQLSELKICDSIFFSFHSFKMASLYDKCTNYGVIHSDKERTNEELTSFVKKLTNEQFKRLTEIKKYLWSIAFLAMFLEVLAR
jgi:hypothetical protein